MDSSHERLVPLLREGVDVIKMVLFKHLKEHIRATHGALEPTQVVRLTGAAVNELFGHVPAEEPHLSFALRHGELIENILREIPSALAPLRAPLTDALRMQCLCDSYEGRDSTQVLSRAKELGILVLERDVPLPASFMSLVRSWGIASGLLAPSPAAPPSSSVA
ncbi:MAG: hypothetical protein WHS86_11080 [Desulfosoma sp.]